MQTAVRRGDWKLVLNGLLIDDLPQRDAVHLSDLSVDMAERNNLAAEHPTLVAELRAAADQLAGWHRGAVGEQARRPDGRRERRSRSPTRPACKVYDNPNNPAIGDT